MRGRAVRLAVFDKGHIIGVMANPERDDEKPIAFRISVETAEKLIGDLQDALKQAARARREHSLDQNAGVYG